MKTTRFCLSSRLTTLALFLITGTVLAQESARQSLAGGEAPKSNVRTETAKSFPYRPISTWQGERFIFLPCPKGAENGVYDDFVGARKRKDYAGRVAKVVSVSDFVGRAHL